jgi:hypothetical protein
LQIFNLWPPRGYRGPSRFGVSKNLELKFLA